MPSDPRDERREALALVGEIATEVAHELRNLLQLISSSAYVARHEASRGNATSALPHVVKIEKSAHFAQELISDVMLLATGDALQPEQVALEDVLAAARADLAAGAAWVDDVEPRGLRVCSHGGLLARLFHALYENAVHASAPRPPTITTRAVARSGRVVVDVADDGPGVPSDLAPRVFEPLVTARPGGTGLGLALARRIAKAHGGSVALVDALSGATFRVELPETA